jgi:calcineurin-like phosphoesterase family protein
MSSVLFIADSHFSHFNIIRHCNRPWKTIEEHDEALIERWNLIVSKRDIVYHLGDFAMIPKQPGIPSMKLYRKLRNRLNGRIHLAVGNHDHMSQEMYSSFSKVYDFGTEISVDGEKITLCHFPMRSWNRSFHGSMHLFGHVHGRLENVDTGVSQDVGVDVPQWNYSPVPWDILKPIMLKKRELFKQKFNIDKNI